MRFFIRFNFVEFFFIDAVLWKATSSCCHTWTVKKFQWTKFFFALKRLKLRIWLNILYLRSLFTDVYECLARIFGLPKKICVFTRRRYQHTHTRCYRYYFVFVAHRQDPRRHRLIYFSFSDSTFALAVNLSNKKISSRCLLLWAREKKYARKILQT